MKNVKVILFILAMLVCMVPTTAFAQPEEGDPAILAMIHEINDQLDAEGLDFRLVQIELYTIGLGRPINRIIQTGTRWVPYDPRRLAQGDDITYLVDQSQGNTNGLTNAQTEPAIDSAMATWDTQKSLQKVVIMKASDPGTNVTVYDGIVWWMLGYVSGNPFAADIVHAGWHPKICFDLLTPGGGNFILAMEVTFAFIDASGQWSDINGDNYVDTAFSEIYYNDNFAWGINVGLPGIDVETVALHESGHSLGVGHFGPPPEAVMNPVYDGISWTPYPIDNAGMAALWRSWPNP